MQKIIITLFIICILFISPAYGAEGSSNSGDGAVPPGMESIKEGDVNVVVFKGGKMRKHVDVLMPETTDEYAARKFTDSDYRFEKIEKELAAQKNELSELKSAVKKLEEDGRKK